MAATARLSSRFQISIPKAAREAQGWRAGQVFAFVPKGVGVLLAPVPHRDAPTGIAGGASRQDCRDRNDRF
jgi:bifunctional DNA-binding transcriptional regulator/antitoxin component of YhaV-PrlF toxin-antitoxin module